MENKQLKIVRYPSKILRKKTREVKTADLKDPKLSRLISEMERILEEENGVGLAAPQVGSDLRLCLVKTGENTVVLINPKIKSFSRRKEIFEEGCLSFPGTFYMIERPSKVKVSAKDLEGKKVKIKADGLLSRALQHEIDHLDGILLIDRTDPGTQC